MMARHGLAGALLAVIVLASIGLILFANSVEVLRTKVLEPIFDSIAVAYSPTTALWMGLSILAVVVVVGFVGFWRANRRRKKKCAILSDSPDEQENKRD